MNRNVVAAWLMLSMLAATGTQAIAPAEAAEEGPIDAKLFVQAFQMSRKSLLACSPLSVFSC